MAFPGISDCSTQVADERLLYAGQYAALVHGLGEQNSPGRFPVSMISGMGMDGCPCQNKGMDGVPAESGNDLYSWMGDAMPPANQIKTLDDALRLIGPKLPNYQFYHETKTTDNSMFGLGAEKPRYDMFPPGPKPQPYEWNGWKLVLMDGKWMYNNPNDSRLFVTPSNLYDMIGIPKNKTSGFPLFFADDGSFDLLKRKVHDTGTLLTVALLGIIGVTLFFGHKEEKAKKWKPKTIPRHAMKTEILPGIKQRFGRPIYGEDL